MNPLASIRNARWFDHPLIRKCSALIGEDLRETYSRDTRKWLIVAPIIGAVTGVLITLLILAVLSGVWEVLLPLMLDNHALIVPITVSGFVLTGLIMQFCTSDPDRHSTEEIAHSYHANRGDIDMRPFWWKLLASVTTVGFGGSAGLEGPSIYGGGAIGSWLWAKLRRLGIGLEPRERRITLISGAAAGMGAVFHAPLTGLIFALEVPYKDDVAHEALLPSLISAVVAYTVLAACLGTRPLFAFGTVAPFSIIDLLWGAALGVICGFIAMNFANGFGRVRKFFIKLRIPHTAKLAIGGVLTGICGLAFVSLYPGGLIPLGPDYEAVGMILTQHHSSVELAAFAVFKLLAALFTLGCGGVSAMFVPLFLTGGAIGKAFSQALVHTPHGELFTAVGMSCFIAAGYKAPLTAVIFVAETSGGYAYIIPTLIGAAVAYAVSGLASVSSEQTVHETVKLSELGGLTVSQVMQQRVVGVQASATLRNFADSVAAHHQHASFPVYDGTHVIGAIPVWGLSKVRPERWDQTLVRDLVQTNVTSIGPETEVAEALHLLRGDNAQQILLVTARDGSLMGIVTKTDILRSLGDVADGKRRDSDSRSPEQK